MADQMQTIVTTTKMNRRLNRKGGELSSMQGRLPRNRQKEKQDGTGRGKLGPGGRDHASGPLAPALPAFWQTQLLASSR
jgi:hypothetical protein